MRSQYLFSPWTLGYLLAQSVILTSAAPNPLAIRDACSKQGCQSSGQSPVYCASGAAGSCAAQQVCYDIPESQGNFYCDVPGKSPGSISTKNVETNAPVAPAIPSTGNVKSSPSSSLVSNSSAPGVVDNPRPGDGPYPIGTQVKVGSIPGVGPQYCQVTETAGGRSACIRGKQRASTYESDPASNCQAVKWTKGVDYVAAYFWDKEEHPTGQITYCGQKVKVKNSKTGKQIEVTVVDACPTCTGIRPSYNSEWASLNGATIDLDAYTFAALTDGETTGKIDVEYEPLPGDDSIQKALKG